MRYSRKEYLQSLDAITMEPAYRDEEVPAILRYLDDVYERSLKVLSAKLNHLHGMDHDERYWRILTGTWLKQHIHMLYDRYLHVSAALSSYPDLSTVYLDESSFQTPGTTIDYIELLKGDLYNLQIFTKIMRRLNREFPKLKADLNRYVYSQVSVHKPPLNRALTFFKKQLASRISAIGPMKRKIVYHNAYFPRDVQILLLLKTKLRLSPFYYPNVDFRDTPCSRGMRDVLKDLSFGENEFEKMLFDFISEEIPLVFVEKYRQTAEEIDRLYPFNPKAVMSATSWHYNDFFKLWAASRSEKGALLVGLQHGGGYGILDYWLQERQELAVVDRYYSWGWSRDTGGIRARVKPLTPTKLVGRRRRSGSLKTRNILYDLTTWSRYLVQFPVTTDYWRLYYRDIAVFSNALSEKVIPHLILRPHREDMGWELVRRLEDIFPPGARIETWDVPFIESLESSSLFLCGHPTYCTTFIEALQIDKPTILFYDPHASANALTPEARESFALLSRAGILFENPLDAAKQVNSVHEHVDEWWAEKECRGAVAGFIEGFARVSKRGMDEWIRELEDISNSRHVF